jgi:hypothetical protein
MNDNCSRVVYYCDVIFVFSIVAYFYNFAAFSGGLANAANFVSLNVL